MMYKLCWALDTTSLESLGVSYRNSKFDDAKYEFFNVVDRTNQIPPPFPFHSAKKKIGILIE